MAALAERPARLERGLVGVQALRITAVLAVTAVAYHYSLQTLLNGLTLDTPLAYLALVPVIGLVLMLARGLAPNHDPDIHDRYLDYMIGTPFLVAALVLVVLMPARLSSFYWLWRIDLLSLPLFVAGAVTLVFGLRAVWRVRGAIAFLFLAWPLPYLVLLNGDLNAVTAATLAVLRVILRVVPVAQALPSADGSLFAITHEGAIFTVSVGSACSGVNGMVGFALVGLAFASLVRGRLAAKLLWLTAGLALIWALDITRILIIFAAGARWGEAFALNVLHPFVGLAVFSVGVVAMILSLRLFRLRLASVAIPRRASRTSAPEAPGRGRPAVKRAGVALAILAVLAAIASVSDGRMENYELVAQSLGPPRLVALSVATATVPGWTQKETASYPWVSRYFGRGASWDRFVFSPPANGAPSLIAPVTLDIISTSDLHAFSAYGLEACYRFHNYRILETRRVDLGAGIVGHTIISATGPTSATWNAVYWEWPVLAPGGQRYERVILNLTEPSGLTVRSTPLARNPVDGLQLAVTDALGGSTGQVTGYAAQARNFLVGFAQGMVAATAHESQLSPRAVR